MTGKTFGIVFHYDDGTTFKSGSWVVPHDTEYTLMEGIGTDVGWTIVHEMAKQPRKTVVRIEIVPWPVANGQTKIADADTEHTVTPHGLKPGGSQRGQGIVSEGSWAVFAEKVTAERDELREEVAHLRRVVALERADLSAALPGWHFNPHAQSWFSDHGWGVWRVQFPSWSAWLGKIRRGCTIEECPIELRDSKQFHTVWDAMNAAPPV
jgi:hypothetical protein